MRMRSSRGLSVRQRMMSSTEITTSRPRRRRWTVRVSALAWASSGRGMARLPPGQPSCADLHDMNEAIQMFERPSRTESDTMQRLLGDRDRKAGLLAEAEIEIKEMRAAPGQHHAVVDDIGGEIGRRGLQRDHDGLDDLLHGLGQRFGDLALRDFLLLRHAVQKVAAPNHHALRSEEHTSELQSR